ncbi:MAG: ribonuclease III [Firmicutes bacterium]|nr:ribonuclease III [Bacillota bacterium]
MQNDPGQKNILELAYLGDALYELYVREHVLRTASTPRADLLHKEGVRFVCAAGQAEALRTMADEGFLTEDEADFARRAHNHKTATKPKNADPVDYKWATAFEALLGLKHLSGEKERLAELMRRAIEITEERHNSNA